MYTRVTQRSISITSLAGLQSNLDRLGKLQQQLSSGRQISVPSDSPTGTVTALQIRGEMRSNDQYTRNAEDGLGWLGTIETSVGSALSTVNRVRDLTLQGISTGVSGPDAREAMATEIEQIRDGLIQTANARYLDRPVFGGTTPQTIAFDPAGTYTGDSTPVVRTVGDNSAVRVDLTGPEVFGTGSTQLFAVLSDIVSHLRGDPSQLSSDLGNLDIAKNRMLTAVADVGARYNRVDGLRQTADDRILTLKSSLANVENIDLPKTVTDLQMAQVAYQAALGATAKAIQPSLLDFLR
ncbi:MAG TPA: flagellar hook-associated protein FlgL [Mycobacteriales bacterium]|jgi:flagellar hook-associated protein 3 FlgL|nr:flagellar hook-associated protein FlgL [Mycobacteriales bacterium]